jgi:hypothetical protein
MIKAFSKLLSIVLVVQIYTASFAADKKFDIIQNGKSIGSATLSEVADPKSQSITYAFQCDYTMNIGVEISVSDYLSSIFTKDTLQNCKVVSMLNGKERFSVEQSIKSDKTYKRTVNKKDIAMTTSPILYSYIKLYTKMPSASTKSVFSEYYGKNIDLKKTGENTFYVGASTGNKSTFYYDAKGDLKKVSVVSSVGTYDIIPRQ